MNDDQNRSPAPDEAEAEAEPGRRPWSTTLMLFVIVGLALVLLEYLLNWLLPVR
jgi:ferric-dicitrate binding protein FerR (iron transport regulator)